MVHPFNGKMFSSKKEQTADTFMDTDASQKHWVDEESQTERPTYCVAAGQSIDLKNGSVAVKS